MHVMLPIRVQSTPNLREHWSKGARRAKEQRLLARLALQDAKRRPTVPELPVTIMLTRYGPNYRPLDGDNLGAAFKAIRDGIADFYRVDDGDARYKWVYAQVRCRTYAVGIEIQARG